jgi:large subunit ribosomal protein L22
MQAHATSKFIRMSPTKIRQLLVLIKGKDVNSAQDMLRLSNRPAARKIEKVLKSAVANARDRFDDVDVDELRVMSAIADPGPIIKRRWMPRARGRATPVLGRTSHIKIIVGNGREEEEVGSEG